MGLACISGGSDLRDNLTASHMGTGLYARLTEKVGRLSAESLRDVEAGIRLVLAL